jgi:hypothetical protein
MDDSGKFEILYPDVSEAEVQAELWVLLKMQGYDARLDVAAPNGRDVRSRSRGGSLLRKGNNRLDVVIFHMGVAALIVEVKRSENPRAGIPQQERYGALYRPTVLVCRGNPRAVMDDVNREMMRFYLWFAAVRGAAAQEDPFKTATGVEWYGGADAGVLRALGMYQDDE